MPLTIKYQFSQRLPVSAKTAYEWCTDFGPGDHVLMGEQNTDRQVNYVNENTIILKDSFRSSDGTIEKEKLVTLYPEQLFWVSTLLAGPNKHSQFLYQIMPQDNSASTLRFTAHHLEYNDKTNSKLLTERLCREDANAWNLLAKAMANELKK